MRSPRYIVGLGSGRCGTASLARLLDLQPGVDAGHERKPILAWRGESNPLRHLTAPEREAIVCDVGFYYLPHVPRLSEALREDVRFVCLRRDMRETVESFVANSRGQNWFANESDSAWHRAFPSYPGLSVADAACRYWDDYYDQAHELADQYETFEVFPTDTLNTEEGVAELLAFAGVPDPHVEAGIHICHP